MKTKFTKLNFITPLLVFIVGFLILVTYSLVVYSSYILFTEGTAMSIYGNNKAHVHHVHSIIAQEVISSPPERKNELLQVSKSIEQIHSLLLNGGMYSSNGDSLHIPASAGEAHRVTGQAAQKWQQYKELSQEIIKHQFLLAKVVELPSENLEEGATAVTYYEPNTKVLAQLKELDVIRDELNDLYDQGANIYTQSFMAKQMGIQIGILISVLLCLVTFIATYFVVLRRLILKPLEIISLTSKDVAKGDISQSISIKQNNEIGELASSMNKVIERFKESSEFATHIGQGKFDSEFTVVSEKDELGKALLSMKDNLLNVSVEDKKRNWTTEGFARFGDILRSKGENMEEMTYAIISNLIKYLQANQGSIYVLEEEHGEKVLNLKSCYAYGKKKFVDHALSLGEGLLGQAVLEKDIIYLTDVPQDYIRISSGLGDANPKCILISPLMVNGEVYGALEIASFRVFEAHEIEFVKKLSETIAATISSVKINEKTRTLLEDSQQLTEQMRAQEEEMRQNVEELSATQEEMERKHRELASIKEHMEQEIEQKNRLIRRLLEEEPRLKSLV